MLTFNGESIRIFYNSDFSGESTILNIKTGKEMEVNTQDLINFVAEYIRDDKIRKIEEMDADELFGIQWGCEMFKVNDFVNHKKFPEEYGLGIITKIEKDKITVLWEDEFGKKWEEVMEATELE